MHEIDLKKTDLNLLVVLDVLLQERSVTRAAERLFRSQSAVSHALARLRNQIGDPLLVKVGGEMRPTPKANHLAPEVSRLLKTIARVLGDEEAFDPLTTDRVFTLAAPDFVAMILPTLIARMARDAPGASVELVPVSIGTYRDVADGRFDVAVALPRHRGVDGLECEPLEKLDWAVFARADHPAVEQWNAESWVSYPHVRVRTGSDGAAGPVDAAAKAKGLVRKSGVFLPNFMLAAPLLARTDYLMTVPRVALAGVAKQFGLITLPCPVAVVPIALVAAWSTQRTQDPALRWFRQIVMDALRVDFADPARCP